MNRDPQPENRDPAIDRPEPDRKYPVFTNRCRKCRAPFDTLNPIRDICPGCVHKSLNPTPLNEPI